MHHIQFADIDISLSGSYDGLAAVILICLFLALYLTFIIIMISPLIVAASLIRRKAVAIANDRTGTIIAQYDPPYGLKPAELGCLYDMKVDEKEHYATLFDLETKGIITINGLHSITVIDEERYKGLEEFEKVAVRMFDPETARREKLNTDDILGSMISNPASSSQISEVILSNSSKAAFTRAVRNSLLKKGFHTRDYGSWMFLMSALAGFMLALAPFIWSAIADLFRPNPNIIEIFGSLIAGLLFAIISNIFAWPIFLLFGFIVIKIVRRFAGNFWINSKDARKAWPTIEGYRIFLKQTDLDDIQFQSRNKSSKFLGTAPYAVVLNLDTGWKQRFK